jgi:transcriptional regulator with XRE-family HTH domain
MKRYQKLIQTAVEDPDKPGNSTSRSPTKKHGYGQLARAMETPSTSIYEWATHSYKVPQLKSLERIAAYFRVPLPTLLMEYDDPRIEIVDTMYQLDDQRLSVLLSHAKALL